MKLELSKNWVGVEVPTLIRRFRRALSRVIDLLRAYRSSELLLDQPAEAVGTIGLLEKKGVRFIYSD